MKFSTTIIAAAVALGAMAVVSCSGSNKAETVTEEETAQVAEAPASSVIILNDDEMFRPDKAVETPTVLDFNAVWCVPCKKLAPAFDKASGIFDCKVEFYSVDIEKNPLTAEAFEVSAVPTVIILAPGKDMQVYTGLNDFATVEQLNSLSGDDLTEAIFESICAKINAE